MGNVKTNIKPQSFKEKFLEMIAEKYGVAGAAASEDVMKGHKKQVDEAMQGGMTAPQILQSLGIDVNSVNDVPPMSREQPSSVPPSQSPPMSMEQPSQPQQILQQMLQQAPQTNTPTNAPTQGQYSTKPASSPFGFGGMTQDAQGNFNEQKPGFLAALLSTIATGSPNSGANLDMNKLLEMANVSGKQLDAKKSLLTTDPSKMAQAIDAANEKAPDGYEAAMGYDGDIYYKTKPVAENELIMGNKEEQFKQKRLQAMGDDLDPAKNVRNPYGVAQLGLSRAERIEGLVSQYKDLNLDRRETEELAIGLNAMLQGSNVSAQHQVAQLVPQSVTGNVQKLTEFLINQPQGLKQQQFVRRMLNDVLREKKVFQGQVYKFARAKVAKYSDLRKKYPEEWNDIVKSFGIDPNVYDEWKKGGFKDEPPIDVAEQKSNQSALPPDKSKRLEELRKKKAEGTLGR